MASFELRPLLVLAVASASLFVFGVIDVFLVAMFLLIGLMATIGATQRKRRGEG